MRLRKRRLAFVGIVLSALVVTGCNQSADSGGSSEMDDLARMLDQPKQAAPEPAQPPVESPPALQPEASQPEAPQPEVRSATKPEPVEPGGYMTAIVRANRSIRTRTDNWPWIQAVQHFKATEGRLPQSHEEFMNRVIIPLGIPLPELEPGEEYLYVPDEGQVGELYIVRQQP